MSNFYMILTSVGIAKIANSQVTSQTIDMTQMAVGDSSGAYYNPTQSATALKNETWRGPVSSVAIDEQNSNWVVVDGVIPANVGGFTIREIGLYDSSGSLIAIGKVPETYKPTFEEGSSKDLFLKSILEVSNASAVTIKADPSVIIASKKYVDDQITVAMKSVQSVQQTLQQHTDNKTTHIQPGEREKWNDNSIVVRGLKTVKSNKDANGIFTTVKTYRKTDNKLYQESILSGGTSPNYTKRTVKTYGVDGTTVLYEDTYLLAYDANGDLISEG